MSSLVPDRTGGYNGATVSADQIKQRTISNNQEIFETITSELEKATSEILVVAAWFTDDTLLHILKTKAEEGLTVQIIVSDNEDNRKLDFDSFPDATANVLRVKNVGYGMMHQKYCVIDRITAIHGSYNWTVNAKKNNHESVIITNHKQTVDELILNFEDIKNRLQEIEEHGLSNARAIKDHFKNNPEDLVIPEREELSTKPIQEEIEERKREYEEVLDTMIAAEVSHYDRSGIVSQGYQRAKSTNGDHQVLPNAFDSVYSSFIADIDALEDKKNRLLNRIEEQRAKNIQGLEAKEELEINSIMVKYETKHQVLSSQITNTKSQIALNEAQVQKLETQDVHQIETRIATIKEEINTEEREFIRPSLKWFELLPATVINIGLFFYLVLFYSSAAYILMFSELDAKEAKMNGVSILPPEVFNPNALSMAVDKGGTAIPFVLLFVFVPMTLSIIGKLLGTKRLWNTVLIFTGVIVVDAFIAYVVSKSIHEVEYLSGNVDEVWHMSMVLGNPNFYLVFVMGALGLLLFKFAFDKLMGIFEDRNPQIAELRSKKTIEQHRVKINELEEHRAQVRTEIHELKQANIICAKDVSRDESVLNHLPESRESEIARIKSEANISIEGITRITDVYISHIENDNYLISFHAIRDRISTFLDGWFQYLHEEYSIAKATNITRLSREAAILWQEDKLISKNLDNRINR